MARKAEVTVNHTPSFDALKIPIEYSEAYFDSAYKRAQQQPARQGRVTEIHPWGTALVVVNVTLGRRGTIEANFCTTCDKQWKEEDQ